MMVEISGKDTIRTDETKVGDNSNIGGISISDNSTKAKTTLLDNHTVEFTEQALNLYDNLQVALYGIDSIMNDEKKLRISAYDYRFLSYLKGLVDQIKAGKLSTGAFGEILNQKLEGIKASNPELAQAIETELVKKLSKYGLSGTEQSKVLQTLSAGISEPEKLAGRIDVLQDFAERKLGDGELKKQILSRLILIQRYLGEANALNYCVPDANSWNLHVHDDITFFTSRLDGYFRGDLFQDHKGNVIPGIDNYRDEELRKAVFESREVKELFRTASFTHRVGEQVAYISRLVAFLQRDIDTRTNTWKSVDATREFYQHMDRYADTFKTEFLDNPFASYLLSNKKKIGEQPFKWIAILNGMKGRLEELMRRKGMVITNTKNYIVGVFGQKIEDLRQRIRRLALQINQLIMSESGDIDWVKKIEEGLRKVEKIVNKLWKDRKRRFILTLEKIEDVSAIAKEHMQSIVEMTSVDEEAKAFAQNSKGIVDFSDHQKQVIQRVGTPNSQKIPYLIMLDFDFTRIGDLYEELDAAEEEVREKERKLEALDLTPTKIAVESCVKWHLDVFDWAAKRLNINISSLIETSNRFLREHYG